MTGLTNREELAVVLVLTAGVGDSERERQLIRTLAGIEYDLIAREWEALERWLAYMGGAKVENELKRQRLVEDVLILGWHLRAPEGQF